MSKLGLVSVIAGYIDDAYEDEGPGPVFRAYMMGVVDTVRAVFDEDGVDKVLRAIGGGARRDWIDESTAPYGREDS